MKTITLQDIKRFGSKALSNNEPLYLIVNSKPKSVIIPLHEYESMVEAMEELEDILDIEARKNEKTVSHEDALREIEG